MEPTGYVVLHKLIGQTPLQCMEAWRTDAGIPANIPLTYAGRLDPMASGKLLVLIGEECKKKDEYLGLDKTYEFSVLFGIGSDTHDVLGRLTTSDVEQLPSVKGKTRLSGPERPEGKVTALKEQLIQITQNLTEAIELPYPHFSSKTVDGKPLFQWTLEGRLDEIAIPTKESTIHSLELDSLETKSRATVCAEARAKIDTIAKVTNPRKDLGSDFRRADVRADWERIQTDSSLPDQFIIAHFTCSTSSGTYMRTLAKLIGEQLDPAVPSLAWHIERTRVGRFIPATKSWSIKF